MLSKESRANSNKVNGGNMGKVSYRLKGHESFVPREGWITKGLRAAKEDPTIISSNYAADVMGVGTNMAKSIRFWLRTAGLTRDVQKVGTVLTPLGTLVLDQDPYLEKDFTLWILHANIVRNFAQATTWNVFFNDFDLNSWKRDEMCQLMEEYIIERTGDTALSSRSIKDDCNAILAMYTAEDAETSDPEESKRSPFTSLGLIKKTGSYYTRCSRSYSQVGMYPVLYMIANDLNHDGFLSIDHILSADNMPGKVFFMNRIQLNNALDALASAGFITVNRTAGLDMVYPVAEISSEEAVSVFYSNNCADGDYII